MTDTLPRIVDAWREVLEPAHVGADTDFFDIGGNSLSAARIVARIARDTGLPVRVKTLFAHPTPRLLAAALAGGTATAPTVQAPTIRTAADPGAGGAALSSQQEAAWFAECLNPGGQGRSRVRTVRLHGLLDVARLRRAAQNVVDRHETLRTTFTLAGGTPVQNVTEQATAQLRVHGRLNASDEACEFSGLAAAAVDTGQLPLVHWAVYDDARGGWILAQVEHPLVLDARSGRTVLADLATAYRDPDRWREPTIGYPAFARRQHEWLGSDEATHRCREWAARLAGEPDIVRFPDDDQRPRIFSRRAGTVPVTLTEPVASQLTGTATALGVTPFALLFAAFAVLIEATTGALRPFVGTAFANRDAPFDRAAGTFANVLAIPVPAWVGRRFPQVARDVADLLEVGAEHQALPAAAVARELRLRPKLERNPLFQVALSLDEDPGPLDFGGLTAGPVVAAAGGTDLDLDVTVVHDIAGQQWRLEWRYYAEIVSAADVTHLAEEFDRLLAHLLEHPDLPLHADLLVGTARRELA